MKLLVKCTNLINNEVSLNRVVQYVCSVYYLRIITILNPIELYPSYSLTRIISVGETGFYIEPFGIL